LSNLIKRSDASKLAAGACVFAMPEFGPKATEAPDAAEETESPVAYPVERTEPPDSRDLERQIAEEIRNTRLREVTNLVKSLQRQIAEINDRRERIGREAKEHLISLALRIARSVVKREVACSDDVARLNLAEAVRLSARRAKLLVRVSEMDMNMLEGLLGAQALAQEPDSAVEIVPSAEIEPGGCLVESASGSVDARIETQLAEIEKVLIGGRGNE